MTKTSQRNRKIVAAEEFHLVDKSGNRRADLSTAGKDGLPFLQLFDASLKRRIVIGMDGPNDPLIALLRSDGKVGANMRLFEDGRAVIGIYDQEGNEVFSAGIDINGDSFVNRG